MSLEKMADFNVLKCLTELLDRGDILISRHKQPGSDQKIELKLILPNGRFVCLQAIYEHLPVELAVDDLDALQVQLHDLIFTMRKSVEQGVCSSTPPDTIT